MSADNIKTYSAEGYNYYTVNTGGRTFVIGGVPERYGEQFAKTAAACDAVILLTSKPEFTGGMERLLYVKPDIEIYGSPAALRNIKEIVNRSVNERLIKDCMEEAEIRFHVTPGLDWVDTVMAVYAGVLFSGQAFSGGETGRETYFDSRFAVNRGFVLSALDRIVGEDISIIYPAYGSPADPSEVFAVYRKLSVEPEHAARRAIIVYSSEYGYTRALAEHAAKRLDTDHEIFDIKMCDTAAVVNAINSADMLAVGTNTINRNAPGGIWDIITRIDTVNKRGMPYFVFGSFGWAGDGVKLVDKTLAAMGLRRAAKPVEALFKPSEKDFLNMDKAVKELTEYEN